MLNPWIQYTGSPVANLQSQKQLLEQQLATVNAQLTTTPQLGDIQQQIAAEVQKQIQSVTQQVAASSPYAPLLATIGAAMPIEDQQWLSANLAQLKPFFETVEGKELVKMTLDSMKTFCKVSE